VLLGGCTFAPPLLHQHLPADGATDLVEVGGVPFFAQEAFQCGPAALAMALAASGVDVSPQALTSRIYLPGRQGSLQAELVAATRHYDRLPYRMRGGMGGMLAQLRAGHAVLVLQNLGTRGHPRWHYAVVIGYSASSDALILHSGTTSRLRMPARAFVRAWNDGEQWALLVLRPGELPADPDPDEYLAAAAALEATGHLEPARQAYAAAVTHWPENTTARLGLGNSLYGLGKSAAAEGVFRELLRKAPRHAVARNNLAQILLERGCTAEARSVIAPALADPDLPAEVRELARQTASQIRGAATTRGATDCAAGAAD
jgi:tetratricopeptide (TPR) repeat protein